jgi:hypothetical protein
LNTYYLKHPNESNILLSPLIELKTKTNLCLEFYYHMYSGSAASIGQLAVYLTEYASSASQLATTTTLWSRAGGQKQTQKEWLSTQIEFTVSTKFRIFFKAKRYMSYFGDIGIDDILLTRGSCISPDTQECNLNKPSLIIIIFIYICTIV